MDVLGIFVSNKVSFCELCFQYCVEKVHTENAKPYKMWLLILLKQYLIVISREIEKHMLLNYHKDMHD